MRFEDYKTQLQEEYLNHDEIKVLNDIKENQDKYFKSCIEDF
jgi:hypothetical protein